MIIPEESSFGTKFPATVSFGITASLPVPLTSRLRLGKYDAVNSEGALLSRELLPRALNEIDLPGSTCESDLGPHPGCNALLFFSDGVCINCRSGKLRVTQPFLHHVESDALADSRYTKPVPQAFR
jgi:hypothetical protein